jgi:DNA-binding response OmpR family regulator
MQYESRSVLLIDDDVELCGLMKEILGAQNLLLEAVHDGASGVTAVRNGNFDLVILDIMLPNIDGFEVLRLLRQESEIPVIMLTARTASSDRISGLELGADDYLPKPFEPRELYARIRGILRRAKQQVTSRGETIEMAPVKLDVSQRRVWNGDAEIALTTVEFDILHLLIQNAGRVVSRTDLIAKLYGREPSGFDRSVEVHICHLRQKLESPSPLIRTIRGAGYQFCPATEGDARR